MSFCIEIVASADVTMKTFVIAVIILHLVCGNEEDFKILDSIIQEKPCAQQEGGVCTLAKDCPKGLLSEKRGLCPTQQKKGIECCYGVSIKETRCRKHGGSCYDPEEFCHPSIIFDGATDCVDSKCCIMVH